MLGLTRDQLRAVLAEAGAGCEAGQAAREAIVALDLQSRRTEFAVMTDIAKTMHPWLAERFVIGRPGVVEAQVSSDGTRKWLLKSDDGHDYEMVFIPDADRGTLCVSSQVGCTLTCSFCHTGTMRLVRNLTAGEIVGQVMLARDALSEWPSQPEGRLLTNIVMMGMGEPLYNFDNVRDALKLVMDGDGLALSKRRITLSTSGVIPMMARAGEEIGVNLAVSLHAVTKDVRDELVPINKKYGIEDLLAACAAYPGANNARRITFEYVMLKDKNDSDDDARELVRLLRKYKLPAKVNLIPFNPWPGAMEVRGGLITGNGIDEGTLASPPVMISTSAARPSSVPKSRATRFCRWREGPVLVGRPRSAPRSAPTASSMPPAATPSAMIDDPYVGAGYQHKLGQNIYAKAEYRHQFINNFGDFDTFVAGVGFAF
jgi:23S rRNA (adenine2503-C2)-methyltransferase